MPETRRHVLKEFLTKARTLNDHSGYDPAFKEETLWDTLVFGLRSDKVRKDAISKGNSLAFQQVYDLAKTEESTKGQMQPVTQGDQAKCTLCKKKTKTRSWSLNRPNSSGVTPSSTCRQAQVPIKFNACFRCGNKHGTADNCWAMRVKCQYCGKTGNFKRVCMKKRLKQVIEIVQSPHYRGHDIYLQVNDGEDTNYCGDSNEDSEPITVVLDTITSENKVDVVSSNAERIITQWRLMIPAPSQRRLILEQTLVSWLRMTCRSSVFVWTSSPVMLSWRATEETPSPT